MTEQSERNENIKRSEGKFDFINDPRDGRLRQPKQIAKNLPKPEVEN
jgi:hypothetical protein